MAITFRIPDELKAEADVYARRLGVSLNALLAVALRDYLDARRGRESVVGDEAIAAEMERGAQVKAWRAIPATRAGKPPVEAEPVVPLSRAERRRLERQRGKR